MSIHTDNAIRVADHQYKMIERLTAQRNALLVAAKTVLNHVEDDQERLPPAMCRLCFSHRQLLRQAIESCEGQQ